MRRAVNVVHTQLSDSCCGAGAAAAVSVRLESANPWSPIFAARLLMASLLAWTAVTSVRSSRLVARMSYTRKIVQQGGQDGETNDNAASWAACMKRTQRGARMRACARV